MFRKTKDGKQHQLNSDPLALPRDVSTDQSNADDWATLGLEDAPIRPNLGLQVTDEARFFTRTGMPGKWRDDPAIVQGRDLDYLPEPAISPGRINRNIRYAPNGIATPGFFSWAANALDLPPPGPQPAALEPPRVDEYYLSSRNLQLSDPAPWVVAGFERPQPGLAPFQSPPGVQAQSGSGWPVLAPEIPSYGSRVPLRRPRGLVGT